MTPPGLPAQVTALRKELAAVRTEIDHLQVATGDVLRDLDSLKRCAGIILTVARHAHGMLVTLVSRKPGRRAVH